LRELKRRFAEKSLEIIAYDARSSRIPGRSLRWKGGKESLARQRRKGDKPAESN